MSSSILDTIKKLLPSAVQLLARSRLCCCSPTAGSLHQLLHCLQEQDVHQLYTQLGGKGLTAVADKATAQQLQALHTENLQLKSVLKQEIEARQQLESQNAALLQLLRYALSTYNKCLFLPLYRYCSSATHVCGCGSMRLRNTSAYWPCLSFTSRPENCAGFRMGGWFLYSI